MDRQRLIELINEVLDNAELADEVRKKLEEMLRRLEEEREPEAIFWARLLSEFIEVLGDKMPPVISDFIKLYAEALRSGIGWAVYLTCIRYWMLREQGANHSQATRTANLDEEQAEWCRALWNLHHLPPVEESSDDEEELPDVPTDDGEWLPPAPTTPDDGPLWADEHHECCEDQGGKDEAPTVDWGDFRIIPAAEGSNVRTVSGTITITHPCGVLWAGLKITTIATGIDVLNSGIDQSGLDPDQFRKGPHDGTYRFIFNGFPVSHDQPDFMSIRAISNCYTILDPPVESPL